MSNSKWERMKNRYSIGFIAYRRELRKLFIKCIVILNAGLCIYSVWYNMPSMIIFFINVVYILKYYRIEYPETSIKKKDRFKDLT